eukprot:366076-Chlamydomonas_euryale.AAC.3
MREGSAAPPSYEVREARTGASACLAVCKKPQLNMQGVQPESRHSRAAESVHTSHKVDTITSCHPMPGSGLARTPSTASGLSRFASVLQLDASWPRTLHT